ncbi:VCBS repeat-containing protein [Pseudenhygromyxa sp. WMMC2535]|uniref:FG-GAP repeat domain-containing protein n=1 Tax=Pseudenhygromyxa sp. WMMC2535 TaxID=2712867 RepID=UPI001553CAB1|nr:VCBS repeat-containing protein [Pseudenhygromyxa sp. WMMC2535]NVB41710.1 VCBS repeat-containing protein [Pseudenhygromyxa sp. WMMC2535]
MSSKTFCALLSAAAGLTLACFSGEGSIGAICDNDSQCGNGQACVNRVCGMCNDQIAQPGELCFGDASEESVFGQVVDLERIAVPQAPEIDLIGAVVNGECTSDTESDEACWALYAVLPDEDGDFEPDPGLSRVNNPGQIYAFASGDFDNDGQTDVVYVIDRPDFPDQTAVEVTYEFLGVQFSRGYIDINITADAAVVADFNADGYDDLLLADHEGNLLNTLIASPGSDTAFEAVATNVTVIQPRLSNPADIDGDGDLDLIVASASMRVIQTLLNDGAGNFTPGVEIDLDLEAKPTAVVLGDLNRDEDVDAVVLVSPVSGSGPLPDVDGEALVLVFVGDGQGGFTLEGELPGGEDPVQAILFDINYDEWPDIVVADRGEDKLPVYISREGGFPDSVLIDVAAAPNNLLPGDLDNDGFDDLAVANANGVLAVVPAEN